MATDLWKELAEAPVPPLSDQFDRQLHERLNKRLLVAHLMDFFFAALPLTCLHWMRAVAGALVFSITGRFIAQPSGRNESGPDIS